MTPPLFISCGFVFGLFRHFKDFKRQEIIQEEDIKNLPGVGSKMTHEFLEYRPYENMAQFNKEIGKYVDEAELSRLARFVYLK